MKTILCKILQSLDDRIIGSVGVYTNSEYAKIVIDLSPNTMLSLQGHVLMEELIREYVEANEGDYIDYRVGLWRRNKFSFSGKSITKIVVYQEDWQTILREMMDIIELEGWTWFSLDREEHKKWDEQWTTHLNQWLADGKQGLLYGNYTPVSGTRIEGLHIRG